MQLRDGPCCSAPGACPALRKSLATKSTADMMGDALCYDGFTLCDPSGRIVQLSLVNQVSGAATCRGRPAQLVVRCPPA